MGFMSRVSRVMQKINIGVNGIHVESVESNAIALSLIAVTVNGFHVESVESNAKINIGVNGIHVESVESNAIALSLIAVTVNGFHVESVESNAKINIEVNGINVETVESFETITATCHFSFDDVLSLKRGKMRQKEGHPELKLYYKRQAVSNRTKKYQRNTFYSHVESLTRK